MGRAHRIIRSGVPTGRSVPELNEGLHPEEDAAHLPRGIVPYEWWYFDASLDNGYSAVVILWPMNYARPWSRSCTIQLSIYTPEGETRKLYVFPPRRLFSASLERCDVRVGESFVRGVHPRYEVNVRWEDDGVDLVFDATLPGWKPGTAINYLPFPRYRSMGWLVPVPRARVSGTITVEGRAIEVRGHGYHDHNWGEAPIFHMVDNWNWGHVFCGEVSATWADITMHRGLDYDRTYMFLLGVGDRLVYESADLDVSYGGWSVDPRYLHPYPTETVVRFGDSGEAARGELRMRVRDVIETQDLLEMVGLPRLMRNAVHRAFSKPYYFRWLSSLDGWVEACGERFELSGDTIHEQMLFRGRRPLELARAAGLRHRVCNRAIVPDPNAHCQ